MTTTRHVSIEDSTHELPANNGDIDFDQVFDAPGVNSANRPFLSYRVNPDGDQVSLQITLNATDTVPGTVIVNETFDPGPARSLNEVFDSGLLREQDNTLTVSRSAGPGSLRISDLIMVYSADS
jgi:hypothetical protein